MCGVAPGYGYALGPGIADQFSKAPHESTGLVDDDHAANVQKEGSHHSSQCGDAAPLPMSAIGGPRALAGV